MKNEANGARKLRKMRASRDLWKRRSSEKQQEIKQLRVTVRDLTASREHWKTRVHQLQDQVQELQQDIAASPTTESASPSFGVVVSEDANPDDLEPLPSFLPITAQALISAKGHVYPLLLV